MIYLEVYTLAKVKIRQWQASWKTGAVGKRKVIWAILKFDPVTQAFIATLFAWGVTAAEAALVFFTRAVNHKVMDSIIPKEPQNPNPAQYHIYCGSFFFDAQEEFLYSFFHRKQHLITGG